MRYLKNLWSKVKPQINVTCALVALAASMLTIVAASGWLIVTILGLLLSLLALPVLVPLVVVTVAVVLWGCKVLWEELTLHEVASLYTMTYTLLFGGFVGVMETTNEVIDKITNKEESNQ
jgi:hypothetical protein